MGQIAWGDRKDAIVYIEESENTEFDMAILYPFLDIQHLISKKPDLWRVWIMIFLPKIKKLTESYLLVRF